VHWAAFRHYRGKLANRFDIVIDEINTIPFFTPLWSDIPVAAFIHQLAREVWWYEAPFPLNVVGFISEPWCLRVYRKMPTLTVSSSTQRDLQDIGFSGSICVLPQGVEPVDDALADKADEPTFVYVGRFARSKRLGDLLAGFASFRAEVGRGVLWLAGNGSITYESALRHKARSLGISDHVTFWGRVSNDKKHQLMSAATALVMTSVREGWGLVVTEANSCGTPAVVYDVPGLRDSVRDRVTGLVVPPAPRHLATAMRRLYEDKLLYRELVSNAIEWSRGLSFDRSALTARQSLLDATRPREPIGHQSA
jgi:glycosyltransferase involved in cell wall biosynthesis